MKRSVLIPALLAVLAVPLVAQSPADDRAAPVAVELSDDARPAPLTPMMREIRALTDAEKIQLDELKLRLESATSQAAHLEALAEIGRLKRDTEIGILEIQLKHAREAGRSETVAKLEESIRNLQSPPRRGVPQPRAEPETTRR